LKTVQSLYINIHSTDRREWYKDDIGPMNFTLLAHLPRLLLCVLKPEKFKNKKWLKFFVVVKAAALESRYTYQTFIRKF